jgi:hypothetical protein
MNNNNHHNNTEINRDPDLVQAGTRQDHGLFRPELTWNLPENELNENENELNENENELNENDDVWEYCTSCYEISFPCTICGIYICNENECSDNYLDFCEQHNGFVCNDCSNINGINVLVCTKCHVLSCSLCVKFFTCHTILCENCIEKETCNSCKNITDCTTCKICNIDTVVQFNTECPCSVCILRLQTHPDSLDIIQHEPVLYRPEKWLSSYHDSDIKCLNYFKCTCKMHYECQITHSTICEECFEICIQCSTFFDKRISVGDICILCKYKEIQSTYNNITKTFPIEVVQQICQY